jgi:hypothetical protein
MHRRLVHVEESLQGRDVTLHSIKQTNS